MDVRVRLPLRMIHYMEELRKKWGLQSRSAVIERLLEEAPQIGEVFIPKISKCKLLLKNLLNPTSSSRKLGF